MESLKHFHAPLESYDILKNATRQEELVKIMIQTLEDFGYGKSAQKLMEESNVKYENTALIDLRKHILEGNWDEALNLVNGLMLTEEQIKKAQFFIYEQKYIETVLEKKYDKALLLLRDQVTSKCTDPGRLHKLAGLMMCLSVEQIEEKLNRSVDPRQSRMRLLKELQVECKPSNMMTANRFNKLLQQSVSYQIVKCPYHTKVNDDFSLLEDHVCNLESFPSKSVKAMEDQAEEVWVVKFSHDGNLLVSLTKNMQLSIWEFSNNTCGITLRVKKEKIHEKEVNCVNWSLDDTKVLTTSSDRTIKVWDANTGVLKLTVQGHVDIICSAVWLPDNNHFISGGIDDHLVIWNMRGEQKGRVKSPRVLELLLSSDGKTVYGVCAGVSKVSVIDLTRRIEKHQIKEQSLICSAALSKNDKFLLLNTSFTSPELHLWSLEKYELVQVYTGHFQEKYRIFCCFGGQNDEFIACGGEDSTVRVWHRNCSEPVALLTAHTLTVNCVSWHPKNRNILVSAGDDHAIKVWASDNLHRKIRSKVAIDEDEAMDMLIEGTQSTMDQLPDHF